MWYGDRIRVFRKRKGMSQTELGERLGWTQQQLSQYELNKHPFPVSRQAESKMCRILGIHRSDLDRRVEE
jgi:transcriptional regulator with XRE-family HTH domain